MGEKTFRLAFLLACAVAVPLRAQDYRLTLLPKIPDPPSWLKITVDTTGLPQPTGSSLDYPNGQVHTFGGILQNYANFVNHGIIDGAHLPWGGNFSTPIAGGRVEIVGSVGGIFVPYQAPAARKNSWLTEVNLGARVALDPDHRVWLGAGAYYLTNFAEKTLQRAYGAASLTVQLGK